MKIIVEYIWLGGQGELRSKTKVMDIQYPNINTNTTNTTNNTNNTNTNTDTNTNTNTNTTKWEKEFELNINQLPIWNYDGSSCYQASTENSEILIKPQRIFRDPFRRNFTGGSLSSASTIGRPGRKHGLESTNSTSITSVITSALKSATIKQLQHIPTYLVLCDTYHPNGVPHTTNTRYRASLVFEQGSKFEPLYGLEQEFFMIDINTQRPLGFPKELTNYPEPQGKYYCGIGTGKIYRRNIMEEAFENCMYAGISLTGMNYEVAPGQCELQVSDYGIAAADHLVMCRYILERTFEPYDIVLNIAPKPIKGDWNGSGCHSNFSTNEMRGEGGIKKIMEGVEKLSKKHKEHMVIYGQGNHERLSGKHETSSMETFTCGIGNRACSIRIPEETHQNGRGYLEDRRPAASMDPYLVTAKILETICL